MTRKFNDNVKNSDIEYCISEYVRVVTHRNMLRDKWFNGLSLEAIAEKYDISLTATKNIIYGIGDKVLLKLNAKN